MTNLETKLYKGIISSDKFLHSHINEILNLFNNSIVKILSNCSVKKYKYINGVKTSEVIGYDSEELNRDAHGSANILVKQNKGQYWESTYIYVSASVLYENDSEKAYFSVPVDLVEVARKHPNNKFLVYSKLDDLWFAFDYKKVVAEYDKNYRNAKSFFNNKGYQYFKYELDLKNGHKLDKTPHKNARYFDNVHIGVTKYSQSIAGTHCFVRVFSKATGRPTTKQPTEYKSMSDAYERLGKFINISLLFSKKTFTRKVHENELIEYGDYIFQCSTDKDLLLDTLKTIKVEETPYLGVVEMFASFGEIVEAADVDMAKKLGMNLEEFTQYCIDKYNANYSEENLLMTEAVDIEDAENIDTESFELSESFYRNLSDDSYLIDNTFLDGDEKNETYL